VHYTFATILLMELVSQGSPKLTHMKRTNVLFVIFGGDILGGSERLVYSLVTNLHRDSFNPSVACIGDSVFEGFRNLDIRVYAVPKKRRFDIAALRMLARIIRDDNIHVVNAHHFMPMIYSFYGAKIANHSALVYTEHSVWEMERISRCWRRIGQHLLRSVDSIVGVSSTVTTQLMRSFETRPSQVKTIFNGVKLDAVEVQGQPPTKESLNIARGERVIGMVANFKKIKNHLFLLKAFQELVTDDKQEIKLLLIGQSFSRNEEDAEPEIRRFVSANALEKNILLLGYREDVPALLGVMDIFCLTSFREGLPISLLEAMAAGLPVVGTDVDGIRDVIIDGRNGYLIQIGDVPGLKCALNTLLRNESLRTKMGQESQAMAKERFGLEGCIKQYESLFLSLFDPGLKV